SKELESSMHRTIKKVTGDIELLKMNTAIASMMSLLNEMADKGSVTRKELRTLLILLNPFAPHITEEMWQMLNFQGEVNAAKWPVYDEAKCVDANIEIVVQINGRLRARITVPAEIGKDDCIATAKANETIAKDIDGKTIVKEIYVEGKLINIVVK
ncbi:MAG: class I tRNA ligase family protein, partial [Oscillospiraceae bacterium]